MRALRTMILAAGALLSLTTPAHPQTAPAFKPGINVQDFNPQPVKTMCWSGTAWAPCGAASAGGDASAANQTATQALPGADATRANAVQGITGGKPVAISGDVAAAATDTGNPIKVGCVFNTTLPTVATGQRANAQCSARGEQYVQLSAAGTILSVAADNSDAVAASSTANKLTVIARNTLFDGTNNVRARGDTTGTYMVETPTASANNAIVPVTALNSTAILVKAAPGNFYGATVSPSTVAGYLLVANLAAIPASGATITAAQAIHCVPATANGLATAGTATMPDRATVGIVVLFSTSCSTYTPVATAALHIRGRGL